MEGACVCLKAFVCAVVEAAASRSWFTPAVVIRTYLAYCMTDSHFTAASSCDAQ